MLFGLHFFGELIPIFFLLLEQRKTFNQAEKKHRNSSYSNDSSKKRPSTKNIDQDSDHSMNGAVLNR